MSDEYNSALDLNNISVALDDLNILSKKHIIGNNYTNINEKCVEKKITEILPRKCYSDYTEEEYAEIVKNSYSFNDLLKNLGYQQYTHVKYLQKRIIDEEIDISHFTGKVASTRKRFLSEILIKEGKAEDGQHLKKKLIKCGLLLDICYTCGQEPFHNNKTLVLQLEHVDGNHKNNLISNLECICPNCHSQSETFAGKNVNRKDYMLSDVYLKISYEQLVILCRRMCSFIRCYNYTVDIDLNCYFHKLDKDVNIEELIKVCKELQIIIIENDKNKITNIKNDANNKDNGNNEYTRPLSKKCLDCDILIRNHSTRCLDCYNKAKVIVKDRPTYEELLKDIKDTNYTATGKKYGVSDNAIRKWIKSYEKEILKKRMQKGEIIDDAVAVDAINLKKCLDCNKYVKLSSLRCVDCYKVYSSNTRRLSRPSYEELVDKKKTMTYVEMGLFYKVNKTTVSEWLKKYRIENEK